MIVHACRNVKEQQIEEPFLGEQRFYEREYAALIQHIQHPPRILARARFLMGTPMTGGGGRVTLCEVSIQIYIDLKI
jgi:glutathionyl-hydroquinone reductase